MGDKKETKEHAWARKKREDAALRMRDIQLSAFSAGDSGAGVGGGVHGLVNRRQVMDELTQNNIVATAIEPIQNCALTRRFEAALRGGGALCTAYHGTDYGNVTSIVNKGLLIGGDAGGPRVAHGTAEGRGVYLGKDMGTALGYCTGDAGRLLVCAALVQGGEDKGWCWVVTQVL